MTNFYQKMANGALSLALLGNISSFAPVFPVASFDASVIPESVELTAVSAKTPMEEGIKRMQLHITAYSSTPDQTDDSPFITAANTHVRDGIVATNALPMYTRVKIPELFGEKVFVVEDRMNRRFQDRMDIWMPDRAPALKFGIKTAEVVVLN
ncbi:MAG: hypothetical protein Q7S83_03280 [bacterium]|nr:hypothetical protein [bacterium]